MKASREESGILLSPRKKNDEKEDEAALVIQRGLWRGKSFQRAFRYIKRAVREENTDPLETALKHILSLEGSGEPRFVYALKNGPRHMCIYMRSFMTKMHHPYASYRQMFSIFIAIVLMYSILSVPYRISLSMPAPTFGMWWWIDLSVDVIFLVDIVFNFRVGIMKERGHVAHFERDPLVVACKYCKLWFWIDLITSVPIVPAIEATASIIEANTPPGHTSLLIRLPRIVRIIRVLRLIKLSRLMKMTKMMQSWKRGKMVWTNMAALGEIGMQVLVTCHLCACLWAWSTFIFVDFGDGSLPGTSWIVRRGVCSTNEECGERKVWIFQLAIYWAMTTLTTVGYGDIGPMAEGDVGGLHPTIEMIVALFVEMASAIVFGYIIGSLTSILSREDRSRVMINEKIDEITSYMQSRGIDELLQKRVVAYYDQVWRVSTIFDENSILTELPSFLRDEVVAGAYGSLATDVPFMQDMPASMVSMLVMALKFETVLPTQCIVRKGTLGSNMYIVMGGLVQLFYGEYEHENFELSDKNIGALEGAMRERPGVAEAPFTRNPEADKGFKISRGDFFCEYTVLFAVPPQHIYTAVAIERTMVLSFPKEMYLKTIDVFPQLRDQILKHTKLANPMVAKLAQHFKNNDALKMNIAVGNMQAISARSAMRYRSLSAEEIREDNEVQWNPIKKSLDAVAQATIHGLERWLDQRQSLLPDDYLDDDDESSVDQHHHHEDSDPHHEMSRPPLPHRKGAASTGAPAAAGNRRQRRKMRRASTLITELSLADAGGSHGALQARLDKLEDVVGKIAEGQTRLEHLLEKIHVIATEEDLR